MNKQELLDATLNDLKDSGTMNHVGLINKAQAIAVIDTLFDVIGNGLEADGRVACAPFGVFKVKERAARKGKNPKTGEGIDIAASRSVTFKPTPTLKGRIAT